jgi:hypothetical protein
MVGAKKSSVILAEISHADIVRGNKGEVNIKIHESMVRIWRFKIKCVV